MLAPFLEEEVQLQRLFATKKDDPRLKNPFAGLVDVYNAPDTIRKTRARVVKSIDDLSAKHVMPLTKKQRRIDGEPCMVESYDEFMKNFAIFTGASSHTSVLHVD